MRSSLGALRLAVVLAGATPAAAEVVERILAVVDGRPVLLSEARLLMELQRLDQAAALEALIDERLMFREAARLSQTPLGSEAEQRALRSLAEKAPGLAARAEPALRRLAVRQATIVRYVETRFRPQLRVDGARIAEAYRSEYGERAGAPPLAEVAEALRERLLARALDERIETWVRDLRAAAEIRYNAP